MSVPVVMLASVARRIRGAVPVTLVSDIDVAVMPGEYIVVTGPSGCGKSSLLYLIGLLDRPSEGTVRFDGIDTGTLSSDALARLRLERIGFVFQFHFLLGEFTALENVMLPMRRLGRQDESQVRTRASALLDRLGLGRVANRRPHQLSGGERQRVAIARALANGPALILADEPTGNLDSKNAETVYAILGELAADEGRAVIVVTHDGDFARRAPRQVRMLDGRIVAGGGPATA
ncbi:MAG: ABC transporter ATP-binding protein [Rhodospirillaceae bacterium]|nr:ABC transporter ATP-binding protein [Rhodospirillaceae bacterium]